MQTTTATTPEVKEGATPSVSHEKTGHGNQKKIQSNNQVRKHKKWNILLISRRDLVKWKTFYFNFIIVTPSISVL